MLIIPNLVLALDVNVFKLPVDVWIALMLVLLELVYVFKELVDVCKLVALESIDVENVEYSVLRIIFSSC